MRNLKSRLAKTLIAGSALLTLAALPDCAAASGNGGYGQTQYDDGETEVINGQVNLTNVFSTTNADAIGVQGDAVGTATAVGNTGEIFTMNNTFVTNDQVNTGNVMAEVNANMKYIGGDVSLGATAVCNGVDVSTDPQITSVKNTQICGSLDPSATVNAKVANVGGVVAMQAQGVGNQLSSDSNAAHFPVNSYQENTSNINASINAKVTNVGAFGASSSAVGNTAQIIHYSTDGY